MKQNKITQEEQEQAEIHLSRVARGEYKTPEKTEQEKAEINLSKIARVTK